MNFMKRLAAFLLTLFWVLGAFADSVDGMTFLLDRLEGRFWYALAKSTNDTEYREVRDMVSELNVKAAGLQRSLSRYNMHASFNVAQEARVLQNLFSTRQSMVKCYQTRFKQTRLSEYQRYARNKGVVKRNEPLPTLATLDLEHYRIWLEDLQISNRSLFRRTSGERSAQQDADFQDKIDHYLQSYLKLRLALAEIRQEMLRRGLRL